jgi:hypothetical protein
MHHESFIGRQIGGMFVYGLIVADAHAFNRRHGTMRNIVPLLLLTLIVPAQAEEKPLTGDEIRAALSDRTVAGVDNGKAWQQTFQKGGATFYAQGGAVSNGFWDVRGDEYCSQWPPSENWACYKITGEGDALTFISNAGKAWPVKVLHPAQ